MTSVEVIWTDPGQLIPALILARRRLCVVTTYGDDERIAHQGTGFLIGSSMVLTNFHVLEGLPPRLDHADRIRVRFDHAPTTGPNGDAAEHRLEQAWCLAASGPGPLGPDGAAGAWWTDLAQRNAWRDAVAGSLDYAVLRLSGAPGLQRGWYDLSEAGGTEDNLGCWLLHQPAGGPHTVTGGGIHYPRRASSRIFHGASTVRGRRGGSCSIPGGGRSGCITSGFRSCPIRCRPVPGCRRRS